MLLPFLMERIHACIIKPKWKWIFPEICPCIYESNWCEIVGLIQGQKVKFLCYREQSRIFFINFKEWKPQKVSGATIKQLLPIRRAGTCQKHFRKSQSRKNHQTSKFLFFNFSDLFAVTHKMAVEIFYEKKDKNLVVFRCVSFFQYEGADFNGHLRVFAGAKKKKMAINLEGKFISVKAQQSKR